MSKRVRLTIEVDSEFVNLLNANVYMDPTTRVQLKGDDDEANPERGPDVRGVLAIVVLAEARGALPEQVHAAIPPAWRPHIEAIHDERRVTVLDGARPGGPRGGA